MRRTAAGAGLLLLLSGCGSAPPPPAVPAPPLAVSLEQSRDAENRRQVQVALVNEGSADVEVLALQLRAPAFGVLPATERSDVLRPGARILFPVDLGPVDCTADGPARVAVRLPSGEVALDVPDDRLLPRLRARECALQELARAATFSFDPGWVREGDRALGTLVVERRRPVTVSSVEGTVLLGLRPLGPLDADRVPVEVTATRCDPHALAESKRTYDFPVYAAVGDGEPQYLLVRPEATGLALLEDLLLDTCVPQD